MTADAPLGRRSILIPSLFTLAALVVLVGLGLWQLERLQWKEGLIATLERRINAPPIPLPPPKQWASLSQDDWEFRRVAMTVEFIQDVSHAYVYTSGSALRPDVKQPGYFKFAPARLPTGETVVVNVGYFPAGSRYTWTVRRAEITGYLRWPEEPRWFVSNSDASGLVWHVRDHREMAKMLSGWGASVAPFYIDQEAPVPASGLPRPGPLTVKLRNDHLGYALTWFGLAAVLLVVFGVWAVSRRREA